MLFHFFQKEIHKWFCFNRETETVTKSAREKGIYIQSHGLLDSAALVCSLEPSSHVCILKDTRQCAVICSHILKPEGYLLYLFDS